MQAGSISYAGSSSSRQRSSAGSFAIGRQVCRAGRADAIHIRQAGRAAWGLREKAKKFAVRSRKQNPHP